MILHQAWQQFIKSVWLEFGFENKISADCDWLFFLILDS